MCLVAPYGVRTHVGHRPNILGVDLISVQKESTLYIYLASCATCVTDNAKCMLPCLTYTSSVECGY